MLTTSRMKLGDDASTSGSAHRTLSQWTRTFPRYDIQRRVAPDDREDVREARQGEDHNHSASTTQMVDGKHKKKSNKVKNITTARV